MVLPQPVTVASVPGPLQGVDARRDQHDRPDAVDRGGQVDDGDVEAEVHRVPARVDVDGRDPPLLALGAG